MGLTHSSEENEEYLSLNGKEEDAKKKVSEEEEEEKEQASRKGSFMWKTFVWSSEEYEPPISLPSSTLDVLISKLITTIKTPGEQKSLMIQCFYNRLLNVGFA